jgi:hypothetical protein
LISAAKTCKLFNQIHLDNYLWKRHYADLFFGSPIHFGPILTSTCTLEYNKEENVLVCKDTEHFLKRQDGIEPVEQNDYKLATKERIEHLQQVAKLELWYSIYNHLLYCEV